MVMAIWAIVTLASWLTVVNVKAVPFNEELLRHELQSQSSKFSVEGEEDGKFPLQRPITLTDHVVPLEFQEHFKKRPKRKNLKPARLLRKMGPDFDPTWMSMEIPSQLLSVEMSENQMAQLVKEVTSLNLEEELNDISNLSEFQLDEDQDLDPKLKSSMISAFEQWLVKKSSCPITFRWEDLGEYFWPRWIKKGQCSGSSKDQGSSSSSEDSPLGCSWPYGMKCVPGEVKTVHILRWHCRRRSRSKKMGKGSNSLRQKCKWYKIPYPVTSSCRCACQ